MKPSRGFEIAVVERPWLTRGMLAVCSLSLLATSPAGPYGDSTPFTKRWDAPTCTLTAETPACDFLVTITHEQRASGEPFFTTDASFTLSGAIVAQGAGGEQPFVAVHVASGNLAGASDLNVLTEFSVARELSFSGECRTNPGAPCLSTVVVSFQRSDLGDRGGTLNVSASFEFQARSPSGDESGPGELPWIVEHTAR